MQGTRSAILMLSCVALAAQPPASVSTLEKESALGKRLVSDFLRQNTPVDHPGIQEYLGRLGGKIAAQVPEAAFPFQFTAVTTDPCPTMHEPVALPGGPIFVPAALVLAAQDEAELAGMLAHSMEHIIQRHGTRGIHVDQASIPLIFMGPWGGNCGNAMAVPRSFLGRQQANELEADGLAVQAMARAGFDPKALSRYVERVQPTAAPVPGLPGPDERLANLRSATEALPVANYTTPSTEFAVMQEELRRLLPSPARPQAPPTLHRNRTR
jgi:predicted Zn-dependent protease